MCCRTERKAALKDTMSSVEASPSQSPSLAGTSPTLSRRLSTRRGSVSAADPWGQHASVNLNPSRSSSSRLTIVRVPQQEAESGRRHRRDGSNASISSTSSEGKSGRLSFAFSSFTPVNPSGAGGGRPASPGSPKLRPSSPGNIGPSLARRGSTGGSLPQHTKLSPEKLVELAHSSCNPRPAIGNGTPGSAGTQPVSFTPLPDDVYLPFVDRPVEVASLISTSPTAKLFALLSQTFPPDARAPASAVPDAKVPSANDDSKQWTYAELENWFKKVPREEVDDATWVRKARQCVLPRSELIWERLKGAFGIPPELDTDEPYPPEDPLAAYIQATRSPIAIPQGPPRVGLNSQMLDMDVFEPDSPVVSASMSGSGIIHAPPSPISSDLELSIEPVLPSAPPPPSAVDPTTGSNMTSLHEVREEDEEDADAGLEAPSSLAKSLGGTSPVPSDVQGLRISMSSSQPAYSPVLGPHSAGAGSLTSGASVGRGMSVSPSPRRLSVSSDREGVYDALNERGPGHPLFPSNFAHLSNAPTLKSSRSS